MRTKGVRSSLMALYQRRKRHCLKSKKCRCTVSAYAQSSTSCKSSRGIPSNFSIQCRGSYIRLITDGMCLGVHTLLAVMEGARPASDMSSTDLFTERDMGDHISALPLQEIMIVRSLSGFDHLPSLLPPLESRSIDISEVSTQQ
jgi:hypothetical protein